MSNVSCYIPVGGSSGANSGGSSAAAAASGNFSKTLTPNYGGGGSDTTSCYMAAPGSSTPQPMGQASVYMSTPNTGGYSSTPLVSAPSMSSAFTSMAPNRGAYTTTSCYIPVGGSSGNTTSGPTKMYLGAPSSGGGSPAAAVSSGYFSTTPASTANCGGGGFNTPSCYMVAPGSSTPQPMGQASVYMAAPGTGGYSSAAPTAPTQTYLHEPFQSLPTASDNKQQSASSSWAPISGPSGGSNATSCYMGVEQSEGAPTRMYLEAPSNGGGSAATAASGNFSKTPTPNYGGGGSNTTSCYMSISGSSTPQPMGRASVYLAPK